MTFTILILAALLADAPPAGAQAAAAQGLAARAAEGAGAMKAGRFSEAAAIYEELAAARPGDAGLQLNLGMARYMAGRPQDAVEPLQEAERLKPGVPPVALFLGASLLDVGRTKEARPYLERAVAALPDHPQAREMAARANFELGRFVSAATHYRRLTTLDPESPRAWYGLARSYEGTAEEAFGALQQQAPESPLLVLLLADVLVVQERYPDALRLYREALKAGVEVGGVHQSIAELYDRGGKPEWAQTELSKVKPPSEAACKARPFECAFLSGKTGEALAAARKDSTPQGRYWTVRAANRLATEALAHLEALPPSVELHLIRAEIAQTRGRRGDAVTELKAALKLAPGDPAVEFALAEALVMALNFDEALPLLDRLTRSQPDSAPLLYLHGEALIQAQQLEKAIPLLERAVEAEPNMLGARESLGQAYVQAGKFAEAVPHLRAAAAQDEDGSVHYQLARALQATGRIDEARAAMEEYQKRRPRQAPPSTGDAEEPTLTPPP